MAASLVKSRHAIHMVKISERGNFVKPYTNPSRAAQQKAGSGGRITTAVPPEGVATTTPAPAATGVAFGKLGLGGFTILLYNMSI
jgi:hypothetical protein